MNEVTAWSARLEYERAHALGWLDDATSRGGVSISGEARTALVEWIVERVAACMRTVRDSIEPIEAYPVATRLIESSVAAWQRRTVALFAAIVRDAPELGATTEITGVQAHGERLQARTTTIGLEFGNGVRWFYRTRDRSQGAWFQELCAALNATGLSTPLHVRRLFLRPGCSWDEHVELGGCTDAGQIRRYFVRAGMLVRLLERLDGVDFHARNIVGAGEYPVLVDVETLFVPHAPYPSAALDAFLQSPLRSGLLGAHVIGLPGRRAIEGGGLHPGGVLELPFDDEGVPMVEDLSPTIPAPLGDHVDDILAGWDEMDACLERADLSTLLARAPALQRRDLRSSGTIYHQALVGSLAPELLRDETARDEWLHSQTFIPEEIAPLRDLMLPRPMLLVGSHPATNAVPPFTDAQRRRRYDLIRTALAVRDDRPSHGTPVEVTTNRLALAVELGDRILATRFAGNEWHGVRWYPTSGARGLDLLRGSLYDGNAGLGVVFALLARATKLERFANAAREALTRVPDGVPYTGIFGHGGAIYALARSGQILGELRLQIEAQMYVDAAPAVAEPWDAMTGIAGFILGASALKAPPRAAVRALHAVWQQGLPQTQVLSGGVPACAPDLATGIACALARGNERVPVPHDGALAWRLMLDPKATGPEPRDPLDRLDVALAAYRWQAREVHAATIRACADAVVDRYRQSGRWFPYTSIAERHMMSAIDGFPAIIHALLCAEDPKTISIRRLE